MTGQASDIIGSDRGPVLASVTVLRTWNYSSQVTCWLCPQAVGFAWHFNILSPRRGILAGGESLDS